MRKSHFVIWLFVLVCLGLISTAAADQGYTTVSQIPMAVDFQFSVEWDEAGEPHIVTDYPFEEMGADEMDLEYRSGDEFVCGMNYNDSTGKTSIRYTYGSVTPQEAARMIQEGEVELSDNVYINTAKNSEETDWVLTYSRSEGAYIAYQEKTHSQGYNAMGDGAVSQTVSYSEGRMTGVSVILRHSDCDLHIERNKYGALQYASVYAHGELYEYDPSTGLFGGHTLTELGYEEDDLFLAPLACLDYPPKSDNVSTSLSGAADITVRVGERVTIRKSDFALYPEGSTLNGRWSFSQVDFELYGYHWIFRGNSEGYEAVWDGEDKVISFTPIVPGYYEMYAYAFCTDEVDEIWCEADSDFFMLTVLNEDGSLPEQDPCKVAFFPLPSATVGETIQLNWSTYAYQPYTDTLCVIRDGEVLDEWVYEETGRDTFTLTEAGTYTLRVTLKERLGRSVSDEITLEVTEPEPLVLKSLQADVYTNFGNGKVIPDRISWTLDYEGGYGKKNSFVYLVQASTGEETLIMDYDFYPAWYYSGLEAGCYGIRMNVRDDQGDHWIESNLVDIGEADEVAWELILPRDTVSIGEAAFENTGAASVFIPHGCASIGARAFAGSQVAAVFIPASVTSIGEDALPDGARVYTSPGSYAEEWASGRFETYLME